MVECVSMLLDALKYLFFISFELEIERRNKADFYFFYCPSLFILRLWRALASKKVAIGTLVWSKVNT